ncbi:MAG: metallopeptidase family protein [Elusimicrobia bacterium]|nr:metallopeptidase family protein [Elusimicrobiota bacterium]
MADIRVSKTRFRALAEAELAAIPLELRELLVNVTIEVQDEPGPETADLEDAEELLGLYAGPTREDFLAGAHGSLPAKVYLYQWNIEDSVDTLAELKSEIRITLRHELAHHFGFDDEELERVWPEGV